MPSDQDLVGRIIERDGRALELLFERYCGMVRRRLARIVRDGVPPGCRIRSAQARALVACLEKTERWRVTLPRAAGAWTALTAGGPA